MNNMQIISKAVDELVKASKQDRLASLLLVRNLHNMQECKYRCNDGNDHVIVEYDGSYILIVMTNTVIDASMIESGLGDVIVVKAFQEYKNALRASLDMQVTDAGL